MIKVVGRRLIVPTCDRVLGFEGDNRTRRIFFSFRKAWLDTVFGGVSGVAVTAKLQGEGAEKATGYVLLPSPGHDTDEECIWFFDMTSGMAAKPGIVVLQLCICKDMGNDENGDKLSDLIWNSETESFYFGDSLELSQLGGTEGEAQLEALEAILAAVGAEAAGAVLARDEAAEESRTAAEHALAAEASLTEAKSAASQAAGALEDTGVLADEARRYAEESADSVKAAAGLAAAARASAGDAETAAGLAQEHRSAAECAEESAIRMEERAAGYAAAADIAAKRAESGAITAAKMAEASRSAAELAAESGEKASSNAESSLIHMNESARYWEMIRGLYGDIKGLSEVYELIPFVWTEFTYDADEEAYAVVGNTSISAASSYPIVIHCAGEVLGFTARIYKGSYGRLFVNGALVFEGDRDADWDGTYLTYIQEPVLMTEDIVIELSASTMDFSGMVRQRIRGLDELESKLAAHVHHELPGDLRIGEATAEKVYGFDFADTVAGFGDLVRTGATDVSSFGEEFAPYGRTQTSRWLRISVDASHFARLADMPYTVRLTLSMKQVPGLSAPVEVMGLYKTSAFTDIRLTPATDDWRMGAGTKTFVFNMKAAPDGVRDVGFSIDLNAANAAVYADMRFAIEAFTVIPSVEFPVAAKPDVLRVGGMYLMPGDGFSAHGEGNQFWYGSGAVKSFLVEPLGFIDAAEASPGVAVRGEGLASAMHRQAEDNPHGVTAAQVGAYGKAEVYTKSEVYGKAEADALLSGKAAALHEHSLARQAVDGDLSGVKISCRPYEAGSESETVLHPAISSFEGDVPVWTFPNDRYYSSFSLFRAGDRVSLEFVPTGRMNLTVNGADTEGIYDSHVLTDVVLTEPIAVFTEFGAAVDVKLLSLSPGADGFMSAGDKTIMSGLDDRFSQIETDVTALKQGIGAEETLPAVERIEDMTDTSKKYAMGGYIYEYRTVTGGEDVTDTISEGLLADTRLSNSTGLTKSAAGFVTTPKIELVGYGTDFSIRLSGAVWTEADYTGCIFVIWNGETKLQSGYLNFTEYPEFESTSDNYRIRPDDVDGTVVIFTPKDATAALPYTALQFSGKGTPAEAVIEVTYTATGNISCWTNTGVPYPSAGIKERVSALEIGAIDVKARLDELESTTSAGTGVPDYVLAEAVEAAEKILAVRNAESFVFAAVSDLHTDGLDTNYRSAEAALHVGMGMNAIHVITPLDLALNLGDICIGDFETVYEPGFRYVRACFTDVIRSVPYLHLQGNHDQLETDTTEQARQKYYAYIGAENSGTATDPENRFRNYGYRDFDTYKVRVIYLNTADVSDLEITEDYYITAPQISWLVNVGFDFSDKPDAAEWGILVFSHHPLNWYGNISNLKDVLNAYKGKGSGTLTVDGTAISYDFSGAQAGFIAHFHGHTHNFRAETLGTNNVLTITVPNACFTRNNDYGMLDEYGEEMHELFGDKDEAGNQRKFDKTKNSGDDTAFSVVVVDRSARKIHVFNYGAGIDREFTY